MSSELREQLCQLGLRCTAETLADLTALSTKSRWGAQQILEHVTRIELAERARRSLERRMSRSRLGRFKPMADFDWAWPKRIDRDAVEAALRLDFYSDARNVVFVAPQGLGKTMIAQNIASAAVLAGHNVLFTTASQMLLDLGSQDSARSLELRLRHYTNGTGLLTSIAWTVDQTNRATCPAKSAGLARNVSKVRESAESRSSTVRKNLL